jgi:DNA repair photolyase
MNKQKGQMYDWITHTSTHLAGKCPHECEYCSIQDLQKRFPEQLPYSGELRLKEKEFAVNYGTGKTIFIENCNDLFAEKVPDEWIERILEHCGDYRENTYVFQTKNPARMNEWMHMIPNASLLGCTIETNRENNRGNAPSRLRRLGAMRGMLGKIFITIEPIMDFDLEIFSAQIIAVKPAFVNIGADSKGHGLPEPSIEKVMELVDFLTEAGIEIREKHNLERLKHGS